MALHLGCRDPVEFEFPQLAVSTDQLPPAFADSAYEVRLAASGGQGPLVWTLRSGQLPTGLGLAEDGWLSGVPSESGRFDFAVNVSSQDGQNAQAALSIQSSRVLLPHESCVGYASDALPTFEDSALLAAVMEELGYLGTDELDCASAASVSQLRVEYWGWGEPITSLAGIHNLPGLSYVDLRNHGFTDSTTDLSPLSLLPNVERLLLAWNSIRDVTALSDMTSLTWLNLSGNDLISLADLEKLTGLEVLLLDGNSVSDLSPIAGFTRLTSLYASSNSIVDLHVLRHLTRLEQLVLAGNSISDLSPLSDLTELRLLALDRNAIRDLSPLRNATNLTDLYLPENDITDISTLAAFTALWRLDLSDNAIADVSALGQLPSLGMLRLGGNTNLADIRPLLNSPYIGAGVSVYLSGTSVACSDVAALQAKGAAVLSDCP